MPRPDDIGCIQLRDGQLAGSKGLAGGLRRMSGGAKDSAFLAAHLARELHHIIGMLMMGCNQDMATVARSKSAPPGFLSAAVFLSSGKSESRRR